MRRRRSIRLIALAAAFTAAASLTGLTLDAQTTTATADPALEDASWWRSWTDGTRSSRTARSEATNSPRWSTHRTAPANPSTPSATPAPSAPTSAQQAAPSTQQAVPSTQQRTSSSPAPAPTPAPAPVAAPAPAASGGASTPAPAGDLTGWRQVFSDGFDGSTLGSQWRTYSGQPGGSPYGTWSPSQVQVGGGLLNLRNNLQNGQWVSGGQRARGGRRPGAGGAAARTGDDMILPA